MPRTASTPAKPAAKKPVRSASSTVKKAAAKPVRAKTAAAPISHPHPAKPVRRTYIFAVGRRKEAVARVRWHKDGAGEVTVNDRVLDKYFVTPELMQIVRDPLVVTQNDKHGHVTAKVAGGGMQGQAEAVRLGIARALVKEDPDLRLTLKRAGFLRRDPRVKERKKYGLKRARRAPQWQKR